MLGDLVLAECSPGWRCDAFRMRRVCLTNTQSFVRCASSVGQTWYTPSDLVDITASNGNPQFDCEVHFRNGPGNQCCFTLCIRPASSSLREWGPTQESRRFFHARFVFVGTTDAVAAVPFTSACESFGMLQLPAV